MSSKSTKVRFRKKLLIYPEFQLAILGFNVVSLFVLFTIISYQIAQSYERLRATGLDVQLPAEHPYFKFINLQLHVVQTYMNWAFFAGALLSCAGFLFLSHHLVGPLVRLRGYFQRIAREGFDGSSIHFRKNDFFKDLAVAVNEAISRIKS